MSIDWAREVDRYGRWGAYGSLSAEAASLPAGRPLDPTRILPAAQYTDGDDDWIADEWWREQNPGASLMRGVLCALPVAAVMWLAMAVAVWLIFTQ